MSFGFPRHNLLALMAVQFNQEVLQDDVAHVHTPHTGFSVVLYNFTYFASDLALRYVISNFLRNEYMDSDFLRLVRLRPTMMPVEGITWRSMCLLRDYFVPWSTFGGCLSQFRRLRLSSFIVFAFASCYFCILDLGYLILCSTLVVAK